jgi:hypothetical protein
MSMDDMVRVLRTNKRVAHTLAVRRAQRRLDAVRMGVHVTRTY